ncbi:MAG: FAD-binding protein [Pseudolabrys sp.]
MKNLPIDIIKVTADVVVVGGGGAASRAALSARQAGANVRMVTKAPLKTGGSTVHGASEAMNMAAAAGLGDKADSPEAHYRDTMSAAEGFIDPKLVRVLAEDAPKRLQDLIALGVPLDRDGDKVKVAKVDMNSHGRAVSVQGKTGTAFVNTLTDELLRLGVVVDQNVALVDLVRDADGAVAGVLGYDPEKRVLIHYEAPAVVLGTGGIHGAFSQQVSTSEMTGDGQAICFRHGAEMVNVEFHQIGPALVYPYVQLFSAQCFRVHPRILNSEGEEFLPKYIPAGLTLDEVYAEKGFRFTVSTIGRYVDIGMSREINAGRGTKHGAINFSFEHIPQEKLTAIMPHTMRWIGQHGLDTRRDKLEVGIAFQCMNGGVRMTGPDAQSTIPGLFVIGELAGGIRGPDRPGGNSLAEGQVFGHRAGTGAAELAARSKGAKAGTLTETTDFLSKVLNGKQDTSFREMAREIQRTMQRYCLVEKNGPELESALGKILQIKSDLDTKLSVTPETLIEGLGVRNMAQVSELVLRGCLNRKETRSGHYRVDYPETDDKNYRRSFVAKRNGDDVSFASLQY